MRYARDRICKFCYAKNRIVSDRVSFPSIKNKLLPRNNAERELYRQHLKIVHPEIKINF